MGGLGSGRKKNNPEEKTAKIYTGVYLTVEAHELMKSGAFRLNCKYGHYVERLLKSDQGLTLQVFGNELTQVRNELMENIEETETNLNKQKASLDKVNKLLKRLGR